MPNAFINGEIDRITDNPRPTNASTNKFRSVFHGSLEKVFEGNISSCPMSWIWEDILPLCSTLTDFPCCFKKKSTVRKLSG